MTSHRRGRTAVEAWHFERATVADLRERRWLRVHALLIGGVSLALCWAVSRGLDAAGVDSLAWRPVLALWISYPLYIGLIALWARWLLSHDDSGLDVDPGGLVDGADALVRAPGSVFQSGGGGDSVGGSCAKTAGAVRHAALVSNASRDDFKCMTYSSLKSLLERNPPRKTQVPDAPK